MLTTDTLSAKGPIVSLLGSVDDELRAMLDSGEIELVALGTRHVETRLRQVEVGSEIGLLAGVAGAVDHIEVKP